MSKVMKFPVGIIDGTDEIRPIPVKPVKMIVPVQPVEMAETSETQVAGKDAEQLLTAARAEAQALLQQAHTEARAVLSDAEQQVEEARAEGLRQGREEGYAAGSEAARTELAETIAAKLDEVERLLKRADCQRHRLLKDMHAPLVTICMEAVRQLLHRELSVQAAEMEQMVSRLLQYVTESSRVEVRVHPDDYEAATDAHPVWQSAKFGDWEVTVIPDARVAVGGCEIRSEFGRVDASVETKLELLQSTLTSVMERGVAQYAAGLDD